jgi:hypothetical protein
MALGMVVFQKKLKRLQLSVGKNPREMIMQHMLMPMNFQLVYMGARLGIYAKVLSVAQER